MLKKYATVTAFFALLGALWWFGIQRKELAASSDVTHNAQYEQLIQSLKLTHDAAYPSGYLEDTQYRARIQQALIDAADRLACLSIQTVAAETNPEDGSQTLLLEYHIEKLPTRLHAMLRVPNGSGTHPVVLYNNSGYAVSYDNTEYLNLFGNNAHALIFASPLYAGELFTFGGKTYIEEGTRKTFVDEVDRAYALAVCLQTKHNQVVLASGQTLTKRVQHGRDGVGGVRMYAAGSGRGGLVALLAMARSGAGMLAGLTQNGNWARFDCGVLANPMYSLYGAEARLMLDALVQGNTEETKYVHIPGMRELRYELFRAYRNNEISADTLAFEILKRDAFVQAPFVNVALKNFGLEPNARGLRAGALLVMHGTKRADFPINGSRIYANVQTAVQFHATEQTNGMNLLYREYEEDENDSELSYQSIFSPRFLKRGGSIIQDQFIAFPQSLKQHDKFYRWMIRGRAFSDSSGRTVQSQSSVFLQTACGL